MTESEKREKVIKGLAACMPQTEEEATISCAGCPYNGHPCGGDYQDNDHVNLPVAMIEDIRALLKAQEPVKPVPAIDDVGDWLCGNCYQSVVGTEELDASGFVPVKFNFCPNCGREVKWK